MRMNPVILNEFIQLDVGLGVKVAEIFASASGWLYYIMP